MFPNASCLASTFDPALIELVGREIGKETLLKSTQLLMGPTINLHRNPRGGRNFECFSEDPVLTGVIGSAYVKGERIRGSTMVKLIVRFSKSRRWSLSETLDLQ